MSSERAIPRGLHFVADSPVEDLAVAERRVKAPLASVICVHGGLDRGGSFPGWPDGWSLLTSLPTTDVGPGFTGLVPLGLEFHVDDLLALARREAEKGPVLLLRSQFRWRRGPRSRATRPGTLPAGHCYEAPLPWVRHRENSRSDPFG